MNAAEDPGAGSEALSASASAAPQVDGVQQELPPGSCDVKCCMLCSAQGLPVAAYAPWIFLAGSMMNHCDAHPGEAVTHGRTWTEAAIGGAPIWARNAVLVGIVTKAARKAAGFEGSLGLAQTLLVAGSDPEAAGEADAAGWVATVGGKTAASGVGQSSWDDARRALRLKPRQAIAVAIAKLLLWHWSQALAYLWVFLGVYYCELDGMQQHLGSLVAVREIVYMLTTIVAAIFCPAYLRCGTRPRPGCSAARRVHLHAAQLRCALPRGNRFRSSKWIFMILAFVLVVCDFVSCFALVLVLKDIGDASAAPIPFEIPIALNLTGDSASQTGHFAITAGGDASGEWTLNGDELELSWSGWDGLLQQQRGAPVALALGYGITAASFVPFFGPALVASLVADASDEGKGRHERAAKGFFGGAMGIGLAYLLLVFVLLAAATRAASGTRASMLPARGGRALARPVSLVRSATSSTQRPTR